MKGLLKKDLYMLFAYSRMFLVLMVVFIVLSALEPDNSFFSVYPGILMAMLPVTLISYDESFHWHTYCLGLPVSRKTTVVEKYLLLIIVLALFQIPGAGLQIAAGAYFATLTPVEVLERTGLVLSLSIAAPSLVLPLVFRFGAEKGRLAYIAAVALACGLATAFDSMERVTLPSLSPGLLLALAGLVFLGSMAVSVKLYEKREL